MAVIVTSATDRRLQECRLLVSHVVRGTKLRSLLVTRRLDEIVALHRRGRELYEHAVVAVVDKGELHTLPAAATSGAEDEDTVLALLPVAAARAWLADADGLSKWDEPASDAMDVAVVAGGGVSVMRLTARR
jgi:hypothetical protein